MTDCTIAVQRTLVRLLWAKEVKPAEIHWSMLAQNGSKNCMTQQCCTRWISKQLIHLHKMRLRKQCSPWFGSSQKAFSPKEWRSYWSDSWSALNCRVTMWRTDIFYSSSYFYLQIAVLNYIIEMCTYCEAISAFFLSLIIHWNVYLSKRHRTRTAEYLVCNHSKNNALQTTHEKK